MNLYLPNILNNPLKALHLKILKILLSVLYPKPAMYSRSYDPKTLHSHQHKENLTNKLSQDYLFSKISTQKNYKLSYLTKASAINFLIYFKTSS